MKTEHQILVVFIVLSLLIIVFLGFVFLKDNSSYTYNDFKVQKLHQGDYLGYRTRLYVNERPVYFNSRYGPKDVENFESDEVIDLLKKQVVYVALNPDQNLTAMTTIAAFEINHGIELIYGIPVNSAVTKEIEGYIVKNCEDVNQTDGVIILNRSGENKIVNEEGCIIVNGITEEDIIKGADRLVFDLLNVIE